MDDDDVVDDDDDVVVDDDEPPLPMLPLGLREFNLGVDFSTLTNRLGLCYRANCPTQNHLQIGIKGQFGTYWYDCPEGGGKVSTFLSLFACNNTRFKIDLFFSPYSFPCS